MGQLIGAEPRSGESGIGQGLFLDEFILDTSQCGRAGIKRMAASHHRFQRVDIKEFVLDGNHIHLRGEFQQGCGIVPIPQQRVVGQGRGGTGIATFQHQHITAKFPRGECGHFGQLTAANDAQAGMTMRRGLHDQAQERGVVASWNRRRLVKVAA